jgi:RND family efflux transporter MFP subunit
MVFDTKDRVKLIGFLAGPAPAFAMTRLLLAALALGLCSASTLAQQSPAPAASVHAVRTQPFEQVALRPLREAPASVVPRNEARLAAEVAGRVLRWTADTGATVRRGALLVELDATDHRLARDRSRAAMQASQARLALASQQLQRARELVEQGFFSREALSARETEVQLAQTDLAAQRAQLASAELAVRKTRIVSPFDASVKERLAQAGEFVASGTPLYVLTQIDAAEVSAQVALADVPGVRASERVEFVGAGRAVPLKLLRVSATVSAPARTVEVRLAPQQPVVIGSAGQLRWSDHRPHLPASLLVRRERRLGVFVVEAGKARFVALPEAQEGRAAAATLPPQALVVVGGHAALQDGQPVTVSP